MIIITAHDERIVETADVVYRVDKGRLIGTDRQAKVDRPWALCLTIIVTRDQSGSFA